MNHVMVGAGPCFGTVLIALGACLLVPTARTRANPAIGSRVGQMYPDFLLPKLDGGFGRLSDYRGTKVLLIHFASW